MLLPSFIEGLKINKTPDIPKINPNILKRFNSGIHKSTISIGIIKGGENINVVPFKTEILIDRRITSKENIKFLEAY